MSSKSRFVIFAWLPILMALLAIILLLSTNTETEAAIQAVVVNTPSPVPTTPVPSSTPTATQTKEPSPTPTQQPTALSTNTPTTTPTLNATATKIIATATALPTATLIRVPPPAPVKIVYVQSNRGGHNLGIISPGIDKENAIVIESAAAPAWSPDGTKIAFFGEPAAYNPGVWLVGSGGNHLGQLFPNTDFLDDPGVNVKDHIRNIAWSPDGTKLALEVDPPTEDPQVLIIAAETGTTESGRPIGQFPGLHPAWSPDSQKLIVKACYRNCGLWLVNSAGQIEQQLTTNSEDSYPAWSARGYLAFSRPIDNSNSREIFLQRLPLNTSSLNASWLTANPPQRLTFFNSTATTPVFSPNGREIYVRTDERGGSDHWDIRLIRLQPGGGGPGSVIDTPIVEGIGPSDDVGLARPAVR